MRFSREPGRFKFDRAIIGLVVLGGLVLAGRSWLHEHPQHDPWAPLDLDHPIGWATARKLADLRGDPAECRAVLARSGVAYETLAPTGEGACRREDRLVLPGLPTSPSAAQATCPVAAGMEMWMRHGVQPAAREVLDSEVTGLSQLGTYNCRTIGNAAGGQWSEHATGNAIDISAFRLADGRTISLREGWEGGGDEAAFLRRVRDSACDVFATVLSPDYNAAHADHLHLDQARRGFGSFCR